MLKNYFKIALRQLKENKGYSFLNVFGLALGMACATFILLWVNDEYQYNRFHKNYSQLYQSFENQAYEGKTYTFSAMPGPFAPAIKAEFPEVRYAARADWGGRQLFSIGDKAIYEEGFFTDPDFFKMFSWKIVKGDSSKFLTDPSSFVISDKMAAKFFGKENPVGKTLRVNNRLSFTVAGVFEEPPLASSLKFAWLASFKLYEDRNQWLQEWGNNGIQTFVQLKDGTDAQKVNKKLYDFIARKDTTTIAKPFLVSMADWRLRNKFVEGKQTGGRIEIVRLFSIIAILIILIACINFMNLATARSEQRAKEVGVRKVMGAGRGVLIRQFFGESIILSFTSMVIAEIIVWLALPAFNGLVQKKLTFDLSNPVIWAGMPCLALVCGILAGSYPSLYLSSFNPITVLKGLRIGKNSIIVYVRKGLVVTQFMISIVLIISTIIYTTRSNM